MTWDRADVSAALDNLQIPADAVLFVHANAGFLGRPGRGVPAEELAAGMSAGGRRTIILPAFSYSFGQNMVYDPLQAPKNMGILSDFALAERWTRSLDPMFSIWAHGPFASELTEIRAPTSFGTDSIFRRLVDRDDAYLMTINLGAGSTLVHEIEHELGVPYRSTKLFRGDIKIDQRQTTIKWMSYVRDLNNPSTKHDFRRLTRDLDRKSLRKSNPLGRGVLSCARLHEFRSHIMTEVELDARYLTAGGAT